MRGRTSKRRRWPWRSATPRGRATDGAESLPQVREAGVRNRERPRLERRATRLLAIGPCRCRRDRRFGGGGGTVTAPRCSTSTPPVATMRVEPVGRGGCRSRSSRYWSEQVLERADRVERNGEGWRAAVRYTRERGAQPHDPPGNRLIVFKRPRSAAASISRPRRPVSWCTESARVRPRPRAHHQCEFKRDETMHVKARKRADALFTRGCESPCATGLRSA